MIVDYIHIMTNTNNNSKIFYYEWEAGFVTIKRYYHETYFGGGRKFVKQIDKLPKLSKTWISTNKYKIEQGSAN